MVGERAYLRAETRPAPQPSAASHDRQCGSSRSAPEIGVDAERLLLKKPGKRSVALPVVLVLDHSTVWSNLRAMTKAHHSRRTARDQPGGWNDRE
ncbi:MAG: hypothetical protein ACRDSZ_15395 [Pseudonocardiaceae bacterium]